MLFYILQLPLIYLYVHVRVNMRGKMHECRILSARLDIHLHIDIDSYPCNFRLKTWSRGPRHTAPVFYVARQWSPGCLLVYIRCWLLRLFVLRYQTAQRPWKQPRRPYTKRCTCIRLIIWLFFLTHTLVGIFHKSLNAPVRVWTCAVLSKPHTFRVSITSEYCRDSRIFQSSWCCHLIDSNELHILLV